METLLVARWPARANAKSSNGLISFQAKSTPTSSDKSTFTSPKDNYLVYICHQGLNTIMVICIRATSITRIYITMTMVDWINVNASHRILSSRTQPDISAQRVVVPKWLRGRKMLQLELCMCVRLERSMFQCFYQIIFISILKTGWNPFASTFRKYFDNLLVLPK